MLRELAKMVLTETQKATSQLATGAFFFACRPCEYLKVPQKTDILRLQNLRFYRNGRLMKLNSPSLEYADCVSITFDWQKKDERMDTVTQMFSKDLILCPVRQLSCSFRNLGGKLYVNLPNHCQTCRDWSQSWSTDA